MALKLRKPPSLQPKTDSFPYQMDAVRAARSLNQVAFFHEQGLGKTKIAIDLVLLWLVDDEIDTVFIVTKKALIQNWTEEIALHSHVTPKSLVGSRRENSIALNSPVLIYVMNYEAVFTNQALIQQFLKTCRVGVVLDESQKIKNPFAKISVCFHTLSDSFSKRVIMTGTPVANRPYDIWSQVRFLDGGDSLGLSFEEFRADLDLPSGSAQHAMYGKRLAGVTDKIRHFSIRHTKKTAGIQLPDKTFLTHRVELAPQQTEIYESYREELRYQLSGPHGTFLDEAELVLKRLLRLVQCSSNPSMLDSSYTEIPSKFTKLVELLDEIDVSKHKVIVWSCFIKNIDWLGERLENFQPQKVHGRMQLWERNEAIRLFKIRNSCRLLLATPGAAKEGLTLTVANHAVFYDRSFSLDDYLQAQDRIHRISQASECFVHNLVAAGTVDEWVDTLLNAKFLAAQLTQGDIGSEEFEASFSSELGEMLEQILSVNHHLR